MKQIPNSFGILGIVLVAFDRFHSFWISNDDVDFVFLKVEYRNPVFSSRFHTNIMALVFNQPFFELQDRIVEGGETLLVVRMFDSGSSFNDCGNEQRVMYIDATTGLINNFHGQKLLSNENDKEAIDCIITYLTEKLKQSLLYGLESHLFVLER